MGRIQAHQTMRDCNLVVMKKKYFTTVSHKVLVVDDEAEIGLLLKRILKQKFSVVEHALTLEAGLVFSQQLQPTIILLDNNLPDGSGIDRLHEFRNVCPDSCIIVISAMTHLRMQALSKGAMAFIEKPLSFDRLIQTIEQVCLV